MSTRVMGHRVRRSQGDWLALFDAQARSGLSQLRFCEQHGVSTSAFYNAKSRIEHKAGAARSPTPDDFLALSLPSHADADGWDIELCLGGEVVLRIRRP